MNQRRDRENQFEVNFGITFIVSVESAPSAITRKKEICMRAVRSTCNNHNVWLCVVLDLGLEHHEKVPVE